MTFNQAFTTDPGYDPTYDGMSIGEMILAVPQEPGHGRIIPKTHDIGRYDDVGEIDTRTVTDLEAGFGDYRPSRLRHVLRRSVLQTLSERDPVRGTELPRMWFNPRNEYRRRCSIRNWQHSSSGSLIREVADTLDIDLPRIPLPSPTVPFADSYRASSFAAGLTSGPSFPGYGRWRPG